MTIKEKEELTIGRSPLADNVFIGISKGMGNRTALWKFKKDITPLFDAIMIDKLIELKEFQFNKGNEIYQCKVEQTK